MSMLKKIVLIALIVLLAADAVVLAVLLRGVKSADEVYATHMGQICVLDDGHKVREPASLYLTMPDFSAERQESGGLRLCFSGASLSRDGTAWLELTIPAGLTQGTVYDLEALRETEGLALTLRCGGQTVSLEDPSVFETLMLCFERLDEKALTLRLEVALIEDGGTLSGFGAARIREVQPADEPDPTL